MLGDLAAGDQWLAHAARLIGFRVRSGGMVIESEEASDAVEAVGVTGSCSTHSPKLMSSSTSASWNRSSWARSGHVTARLQDQLVDPLEL
jgi:hypothetical protein